MDQSNSKYSSFSKKTVLCFLAVLSLSVSSCAPPKGTFSSNPDGGGGSPSYSGYVIIASSANKTVNLYTADLVFVRTLLTLGSTDIPASLSMFDSTNVLVAVEGGVSSQDRVLKVNLASSNESTPMVMDAVGFTGTSVKGIARLTGGDILVSDSATLANQMERFVPPASGTGLASRVTIGWPQGLLATTTMIYPGPSDNFVQCAAGTSDMVRTYNNAGGVAAFTGSATATAPVPSLGAAHDANGCVFDPSGRVAVLFNGAADSLRVFTNNLLTSIAFTFTDLTKFANPQALAVRPNGNFLVAEFVTPNDYIVEISSSGTYVATYTPLGAATITAILAVP